MVSYCEYLESRIDLIRKSVNKLSPDTTQGLEIDTQTKTDHEQPMRENDYIATLHQRREEAETHARQVACYMTNTRLRDPAMPIEPLPAYQPSHGVIEPDMSLYPRDAREFYALRTPESVHQRQVLAYLIELYNIPCQNWSMSAPQVGGSSRHAKEASDDRCHKINVFRWNDAEGCPTDIEQKNSSTIEDALFYEAGRAVQYLEALLGLSEDQFNLTAGPGTNPAHHRNA
ncbi:hypothetical protein EDB81DRAFT_900479 [Dactylonectria macrodidyma]|uniref:Uncharacterized protein n=1 Tax=Dactylonectria macrodidyma TaxID=307937 RepID=A0A9P9EMR7_9HYPO|nr:hypothetical protein EDB81DRAFT_900479 [Dactylonectria macrodidyma]